MTQTAVARELGVSRSAVAKWMHARRTGGECALFSQARGRPPGTGLLTSAEKRKIFSTVCRHTPKQVGLCAELWSNRAIRDLLLQEHRLSVTAVTVSLWMRQWGFVGPQPAVSANAQYGEETSPVALWHLQEYPRIKRLARKRRGRVFLFDERPLPTQPDSAGSKSVMLCAIDAPGTLHFRVVTRPMRVADRIDFLCGLRRDIGRPLFILLDTHRANPRRDESISDDITLAAIPVRSLQRIPVECWPFEKGCRSEA